MGIVAFARGCCGDLVGQLQAGLAQSGHYAGKVDLDFGPATERAVAALQAAREIPATGRADPPTWERATGTAWPSLFERCLALTARIEGHGYAEVAGNFDGAGLTWGIIGFTLRHGGIGALVLEAERREPGIVRAAFGAAADELLQRLADDDRPALLAWADAVSAGAGKHAVREPWRAGFSRLGASRTVQALQRERAQATYFAPAAAVARTLALGGDLGTALAFDIQVQMGGVKPAARRAMAASVARGEARDARARRVLLARLVADGAAARWRTDVRARKDAIARGGGVIHGRSFDLAAWGFDSADPA